MSTLYDDLMEFDGRAMTLLAEARQRYGGCPLFVSQLIDFLSGEEGRVPEEASWLLKAHVEAGSTLTPDQTQELVNKLSKTTKWQAQLHLCQLLSRIDVSKTQASSVADWLSPCCSTTGRFFERGR